jgi:hypothetical protein
MMQVSKCQCELTLFIFQCLKYHLNLKNKITEKTNVKHTVSHAILLKDG